MIEFDYNKTMERHDVKVPYTLAGIDSMLTVAHIEQENRKEEGFVEIKITFYKELNIGLVRQILLAWDEVEHMEVMRKERETGEFDNNKKGDR